MAAQQPTPQSARIPPDVPNDPGISGLLSAYLRNFALWCREGFAEQMRNNQALRGVMLLGDNAPAGTNPAVWLLSIGIGGTLHVTPMALGGGDLGTQIVAGSLNFKPLAGVVDGSNAPAGQIGEVISNVRVVASALTLTTGVVVNVCTITLTPGDWDVQGNAWFSVGTGGATNIQTGLTSVSATIPVDASIGWTRYTDNLALTASAGQMRSLGPCRVSVSASTPFYLYASVAFPSGTTTAYGALWARRMR